jgi:hypothetical protein
MRRTQNVYGSVGRHWLRTRNGKVDQHGSREIENGEEIEIGGEAEVIGHCSRDEAPDEIACDISSDVGRKRAAGVRRAAFLTKISQRERECSDAIQSP